MQWGIASERYNGHGIVLGRMSVPSRLCCEILHIMVDMCSEKGSKCKVRANASIQQALRTYHQQ